MRRLVMMTALASLVGCASAPIEVKPQPVPDNAVLAIVRVPSPWYAPEFVIRSLFEDAVPTYEAIEGLESKHFILTSNDEFGGVYIWRDEATARAYYSPKWSDEIEETRGAPPKLELFRIEESKEGSPFKGRPLTRRSVSTSLNLRVFSAPQPLRADVTQSFVLTDRESGERSYLVIYADDRSPQADYVSSVLMLSPQTKLTAH